MKERLESVKDIAYTRARRAGRGLDASDDIAGKAMRDVAKKLEPNPEFLSDLRERRAYVHGIVVNACLAHYKTAQIRERLAPKISNEDDLESSSAFDPAAVLEEMEVCRQKAEINRACTVLSELQLQAVKDYYVEGHATKDMAAARGKTEGAVRQTLFHAIKKLRQRLEQPGDSKNRRGANQ